MDLGRLHELRRRQLRGLPTGVRCHRPVAGTDPRAWHSIRTNPTRNAGSGSRMSASPPTTSRTATASSRSRGGSPTRRSHARSRDACHPAAMPRSRCTTIAIRPLQRSRGHRDPTSPPGGGSYAWNIAGLQPGRYYVYAAITDAAGNTRARYSGGPVRIASTYPDLTDSSGTGMPDEWRARYGVSDPSADADGDGVTNLEEFRAGTNPLVANTWTLPEGATGFFTERLALANPDPSPASLTVTYLRKSGAPIVRDYTVLGYGRLTVTANDVAGLASEEFSAVVTSTSGSVVAERTMFWGDQFYGGHTGKAVQAPRTQWYFAEGDAGFFQTWILLANASPRGRPRDGQVPSARRWHRRAHLPGRRQFPIHHLRQRRARPRGQSSSGDISSDVPITVERAMYFSTRAGSGPAAMRRRPSRRPPPNGSWPRDARDRSSTRGCSSQIQPAAGARRTCALSCRGACIGTWTMPSRATAARRSSWTANSRPWASRTPTSRPASRQHPDHRGTRDVLAGGCVTTGLKPTPAPGSRARAPCGCWPRASWARASLRHLHPVCEPSPTDASCG